LNAKAGSDHPRGDQRWLVRVFLGRDPETAAPLLDRTLRGSFRSAEHYLNRRLAECDQGRELAED